MGFILEDLLLCFNLLKSLVYDPLGESTSVGSSSINIKLLSSVGLNSLSNF